MRLSLSPDLNQLRIDGYEIKLTEGGHLIVSHVPYLNEQGLVMYGQLVSTLVMSGDIAAYNNDHVAYFVGGTPCDRSGNPLSKLIHQPDLNQLLEPGLIAVVGMSSKPEENYRDYHDKITSYIEMISAHARSVDPEVSAITHLVIEDENPEGPFKYLDSASSRAGITTITNKLRLNKVVIVGLGGTGSYVLDLVAKTPVREIHLYDGDEFYSHNAFRAPGAASIVKLREGPQKVNYLSDIYSEMKRNIVPHAVHISATNVDELRDADFVFITMEGNQAKKLLSEKLTEFKVPFIDVGIGLNIVNGQLQGAAQTITRTPADYERKPERNSIAVDEANEDDNAYDLNIQIADLNALNAALAVIRWKKLFGFYGDLEDEHFSIYTIDGNQLTNEDFA